MVPEKVVDGKVVIKPYYPYHANAYIITPEFPQKILSLNLHKNIIPVDEFFPIINGVDFNKHCLSNLEFVRDSFNHLQKDIFDTLPSNILSLKEPLFKQEKSICFNKIVSL